MVGEADREAPANQCAVWLNSHLRHSHLHYLGPDVGHYTLLGSGTMEGRRLEPEIYVDAPDVDRRTVHDVATQIALDAIGKR